ncbi:MAG: FHA domain-containing protein, partial [Planctomycetota bacterium]
MTDYVLEILDGDSAGDIFELTGASTSIGRRSSNTIVLNDEKVSGRHAEVVQEEDQFLLKDLGSTNGTLMDGRPITEVVLSPNDIVRVGRLRVAFKEKGAPTPGGEDMRVRRVDAETLAKTRRRGAGIGLLFILVAGLLGFGIWYMRSDISDGGVTNPMRIPDVAGNLLARGVASVEGDEGEEGWTTAVSGLEFEIGGDAHTGR